MCLTGIVQSYRNNCKIQQDFFKKVALAKSHGCTNLFERTEHHDPAEDSENEGEETDQDLSSKCSSSSESEDEDGVESEVITDTFDPGSSWILYACSHNVVRMYTLLYC